MIIVSLYRGNVATLKLAKMTKTLEHLRDLAYRAHNWTSFSPDKRAESVINDYSEELDQDILTIQCKGANLDQVERYKSGYTSKLSSYLSSHSNCASSAITGGSGFNVRRAEKANRYADNHYNNFRAWREKVLKAYDRYEKNRKIEDAGGTLEVAKNKLADLEKRQETMKAVNKAHKAYIKNPQSLIESGLSEEMQKVVISYVPRYSWEPHPFPPYSLTNNNAMIKATQARVNELSRKEEKAATGANEEIKIPGGLLVVDYSLDRVTVKHDQKPDRSVIDIIKKNGFKWSPHYGCWMRKITGNAMFTVKHCLLPELTKKAEVA